MSSIVKVQIRPATAVDLDAVMGIEVEQFGHHAWSSEAMLADMTNEHCYYVVAELSGSNQQGTSGTIVGYAGLLAPTGSTDADVQTIAVAGDSQGQGTGRLLFDELLAEADRRGVKRVFLDVRADNPVAIGMYQSSGFVALASRKAYYQPEGVDALMMVRGDELPHSGQPVGAEVVS